jgi:hypothetical protein
MIRRLAVVLAVALSACGGGGGGGDGTPPPPPPPPPPGTSLAPLSAGSRWLYKVTDPVKGSFDKFVEVVGPEAAPGSGASAVRVRDVEPTQEEWGWLAESNGLVVRLYEEDRRSGVVTRATTFDPGALKWLSAPQAVGWTQHYAFTEEERPTGGVPRTIAKTYEWKVTGARVPVTVPAGTFECLEVTRQRIDQPDEPVRTYWFAPGVGKVRESSRERVEELAQYVIR